MTEPKEFKYIIPKINEVSDKFNTTLTDCFCVVGCTSIMGVNSNNPIYGKPLGYTYDGINYYSSNSTIIDQVNKVDFNGYQWLACGSNVYKNQSLSLSSDGINWITPVNNVLQVNISDIAWGQKKWIAVGTSIGNDTRVAYSLNGMNWTLILSYNNDNHTYLNNVAYNGSYFLIGGSNYIAKSSDGLVWTDVNVSAILGFVKSLAWDGNIWVAAGSNAHPFAYSYNGVLWVQANTGSLINSGTTVSHNGTQFLAAGVGLYKLISSKDGINWNGVMLSSNETYLPGYITDITWNGKYWIVTNTTDYINDPKIAYSADLVTWYSSSSGNKLFSGVEYVNTITSRNRKNYYGAYFI